MKISKLQIKNMFGLKEFNSDGKDLELSGMNGVGKTAVIDAIIYALTNKSDREFIITRGEKEGEVLVETDSGLRINRKVRTDKADYKSIKQGTAKDEKTESFLREFFTELQLNPVDFAGMTTEEQNRIILDLIDFKWDINWIKEQFGEIPPEVNYGQNILNVLHDIQAEEGFYFRARQDINREIRNNQAFIEEIGKSLPAEYSAKTWEAVNLGDLYKKIETIRSKNEWIEKAKKAVADRENKVRGFKATADIDSNAVNSETSSTRNSLEKQIIDMENRIKADRVELSTLEDKRISKLQIIEKTYQAAIAELDGEVKQYEDLAKKPTEDFSELQKEAEHTEKMKAFVNEYHRMVGLQDSVKKLQLQSEHLTGQIEKARTLPGIILQSANIPIKGLSIQEGVPLINGLPISNLSDGEKLELCVSVAVQREGSLKMLLIDGIESLASVRRQELYDMLKGRGVQFVATRTTDDEKLTVIEL